MPAIILVDQGGVVRYLYAGADFADRLGDAEVFEALDSVETGAAAGAGEEARSKATTDEATESVRPDRPAMTLEQLIPYYRVFSLLPSPSRGDSAHGAPKAGRSFKR